MQFQCFLKVCQRHRGRLGLCFIVGFLLFIAPSQALCDERIDRIEKTLKLMQQKIEALSLENRQLKEKVQVMEAASKQRGHILQAATTPHPDSSKVNTTNHSTESLAVTATEVAAKAPPTTVKKTESIDKLADEKFSMDTFQERIRELESSQEETISRLDSSVKVGGYASVEYGFTNDQARSSGFRVRNFSLFFSKAIQKNWQLFSELEFEDAPFIRSNPNNNAISTVQGKFLVEQMYIKYHPSVRWDIVAGRYLTPFGIWNVYHYDPYVPTQRRPLMLRVLFPVYSDGVQFRYSFNPGLGLINSELYLANGTGNSGRFDRNVSKAIGGKINITPNFLTDMNFGASIFRDKDNLNVTRTTYGLHMLARYHDLALQAEFAHRVNNPLNALGYRDVSAYAQLSYDFDRWTVAARYDWLNVNSRLPLSNSYRYTGAVNYHFWHNVIGKIEYNRNRFDNPVIKDFQEVILSLAVAIGDF